MDENYWKQRCETVENELAQLKEQLRWREFEKEQPTEPGYYNVSDGNDSYMEWGCYSLVDDRWM